MIFVPGIHGAKFYIMPELDWKYGYFSVLGIMGTIAAVIFYILKRKQWL